MIMPMRNDRASYLHALVEYPWKIEKRREAEEKVQRQREMMKAMMSYLALTKVKMQRTKPHEINRNNITNSIIGLMIIIITSNFCIVTS